MERTDPAEHDAAATAGAILQPALKLWLYSWLLYGVVWQVSYLVSNWQLEARDSTGSPWGMLALQWAAELAQAGIILWFVLRDREARRVFSRPRPRMVEMCLVTVIAGGLLLNTWHTLMPGGTNYSLYEHAAGIPLPIALLTVALVPAIYEELMFRGLLLERFRRVLSLPLAIAIQAMMFSVMHFDGTVLLPHFAFGALCGVMRVAAGALWPCMLFHMLWNGYGVLEAYEVV